MRDQADAYLDGLAELAKTQARLAALKVQLVAGYATTEKAMTPPAASPQDCMVRDMAVTAEVAGDLTISERAAGNLQVEAIILTAGRPLTMAALQAGAISWQHARIMVDETENLDPAGAAELEAHFLDPDSPDPARGCPAGELVPCRFRAKVRTWRERHHPVSIEKRHARSSADRRVEYTPDNDGMAWFSAYLPAAQAAGIWNRTTEAAAPCRGRARPGPSPSSAPMSPQPGSSPPALNPRPMGPRRAPSMESLMKMESLLDSAPCPRPRRRSWSPFRCFRCSA